MARKVSQAELDRFGDEGDTRVITKRRAAPKAVEVQKPDIKPVQPVDNSQLIDAMSKQHQELIQAIQNIDVKPVIQAPKVVVEAQPVVDKIDIVIGNISRNSQNRIEGAEMVATYEYKS